MNTFEERLLAFIRRELIRDRTITIDENTYLFEPGLIDSLKLLQLIAFVEVETERLVPDREVVMEHFRTVRAIATHFAKPGA